MTEDRAKQVIRDRDALATLRAPMEGLWEELRIFARPLRASFTGSTTKGKSPSSRLFDGTAGRAANNLAAGLFGAITNPANKWFMVRHAEEELNDVGDVKIWCDIVTGKIQQALAADGMGFYARVPALYADMAVFGTGVFAVEEDVSTGRLWFSSRPLTECYLSENDREAVDRVVRVFQFTARQAHGRWGDRAGPKIAKASANSPDEKFAIIHMIEPNPDFNPNKSDAKSMRYRSLYVAEDGAHLIQVGGYHELPCQTPRWSRGDSAPYGDGPAVLALPDIKTVNVMGKTTLMGAQLAVSPPILAYDEMGLRGMRYEPGRTIFGGVDRNGNQLVRPLNSGARPDLGLAMEDQRREAIKDAFHWSLFLMAGAPNRTATEVLQMQEEKLRMLAPHFGNIQNEFLNPLIDRVFKLLFRAGRLPPPPDILRQYPDLRVEYVSPLARAAKASEGAAVQRYLASILPLVQSNPTVMDNVDADQTARVLGDAHGVPGRVMRDPQEVKKIRDQRAQAAQAAQAQQQAMAMQQGGVA